MRSHELTGVASLQSDQSGAGRDAVFQRAEVLRSEGNCRAAIADYTSYLARVPDDTDAWLNRGVCALQTGDLAGAIRDFTRVLQIDRQDVLAYRHRARAHRSLGNLTGSLLDLNEALRLQPNDGPTLQSRCRVRQRLKDPDGLEDCTRAMRLAPQDPDPVVFRGHEFISAGRLEEALDDHTYALQLAPGHANALLGVAIAKMEMDRDAEALADLDRLLKTHPDMVALSHLARGILHAKAGRYQAAIDAFTRALAIDPSLPGAESHRAQAAAALKTGTRPAATSRPGGDTKAAPALVAELRAAVERMANPLTTHTSRRTILRTLATRGTPAYYALMELTATMAKEEHGLWAAYKPMNDVTESPRPRAAQAAALKASARLAAGYLAISHLGERHLSWMTRFEPVPVWAHIVPANDPLEGHIMALFVELEQKLGRTLLDKAVYRAPDAGDLVEFTGNVLVCGDWPALRTLTTTGSIDLPAGDRVGDALFAFGRCVNVSAADRGRLLAVSPEQALAWRIEMLSGSLRGRKVWALIPLVRPVATAANVKE
jgi:tetratricopeptide (TPR) repeat protein